MIRETGMQQQYCLRWNNHKTNLLMVFSELFRNEDFTDVTLACEGGSIIKCHKMVLAACSSYFQNLFSDLSCSHPVVVLKDIRYSEIQAILEYMYKGEVSITQEEVEPLLRVAEALKVKGLVGENDYRNKNDYNNSISTSSSPYDPSNREAGGAHSSITRTTSIPNDLSNRDRDRDRDRDNVNDNESNHDSPNNENQSNASDDKNDRNDSSPPHSTGIHQSFHKNAHFYGKTPSNSDRSGSRIPPLPIWPMTGLPMATFPTPHTTATAAAMLNSCHEAFAAGNSSVPPLRRKKLSSILMSRDRDTPILRTVLGQGQADSSQPMSLVCHDSQDQEPQSNGPTMPQDLSYMNKSMKMETMSDETHSLYMETNSFMDEDFSQERGSKTMHSASSSPQSFYMDSKMNVSSAIANYVGPTQKPEWKRYKQYTRNDIMSAIEAVRTGMSALQAARKFGVPSRTLYDKVKKLGVTRVNNRPFRKSNGSNGAAFPFGISGAGGSMMLMPSEEEHSPQGGSMLEHGFLQHALEGAKMKAENSDREAMSSTPIPLQHAAFLQRNMEIDERMKALHVVEERMKAELSEREAISMAQGNTSGTSGASSSPTPNDRSPSPNHLIKYAQRSNSLTPSPPLPQPIPPPDDDYEDQVEDLSMSRKPEQQSRVIMPPMNQATAATVLATCSGDNGRD